MKKISGSHILRHVQQFCGDIGPRPAGHAAETKMRNALEAYLHRAGITNTEQLAFPTADTWGYGTATPGVIAFLSSLFSSRYKFLTLLFNLIAAHQFWLTLHAQMRDHPFYRLYARHQGGTLIARIPPEQDVRQKVVLLGHTDTNKHRVTFSPKVRRTLRFTSTSFLAAIISNMLAVLINNPILHRLAASYIGIATLTMLVDETGSYVEGANDNGSAVACVLGLGEQTLLTPLKHTELWLAFTGSEEVSHDGINVLLDKYGDDLREAYFIDFEMVGKGSIHFVQKHLGLMYSTSYQPDPDSLAIAQKVALEYPALSVAGREIVITEEVATLRRRGFRGLCIVGVDEDGMGANWHQKTDTTKNISAASLECAAKFAWEMIQNIDQ